jgi:hypothetical protein
VLIRFDSLIADHCQFAIITLPNVANVIAPAKISSIHRSHPIPFFCMFDRVHLLGFQPDLDPLDGTFRNLRACASRKVAERLVVGVVTIPRNQ